MLACTLPNTEADILEWHEPAPSWATLERAETGELKVAERAFAAALAAARAPISTHSLADRFREHADKWKRETAYLSATPMRVMHDSYQSIMAMGPEVVPLLLSDLQKTRRHWFWALRHLTNTDPVPEKDRGQMDKMIAAWIDWGKSKGKT